MPKATASDETLIRVLFRVFSVRKFADMPRRNCRAYFIGDVRRTMNDDYVFGRRTTVYCRIIKQKHIQHGTTRTLQTARTQTFVECAVVPSLLFRLNENRSVGRHTETGSAQLRWNIGVLYTHRDYTRIQTKSSSTQVGLAGVHLR